MPFACGSIGMRVASQIHKEKRKSFMILWMLSLVERCKKRKTLRL